MSLSNLISNRINIIASDALKYEKYIDGVKDIVSSVNPEFYKQCIEAHGQLSSLSVKITNNAKQLDSLLGDIKILDILMGIYNDLFALSSSMEVLISLIQNQNYIKLMLYNMSATYTTSFYHERNTMISNYEKYISVSVDEDSEIFKSIFESLKIKDSPDRILLFVLDNENTVNKFTINLISEVIKYLKGEKRRRVELIVESQKDILLNVSRIKLSKYSGVQSSLVRYGLAPITKSMSLEKLFETLDYEYKSDKSIEDNFTDFTQEKKCGLIVMTSSSMSPVEFNARGLIDHAYVNANDLKTNLQSGLTKKTLERFNTADVLERNKPVPKPNEVYGKGPIWLVFQTINGSLYRCLGNGTESKISSDKICGLITGLSTRAHHYNKLQSNDIINKCFDSSASSILQDYESMKQSPPDPSVIKHSIIYELEKKFKESIEDSPISSVADFKTRLIDIPLITEVLLDKLTHTTGVAGKGSTEYLVTYIARFEGTINRFIKELENKYTIMKLKPSIFKELTEDALVSHIISVYLSIITATIDELDKSRVWTDYDISLKEFFLERKEAIV
jgi:hypothetical protein